MKKVVYTAIAVMSFLLPIGISTVTHADPVPPEPACTVSVDQTLQQPPFVSFQCTPYDYNGLYLNAIYI